MMSQNGNGTFLPSEDMTQRRALSLAILALADWAARDPSARADLRKAERLLERVLRDLRGEAPNEGGDIDST